MSTLGPNGLKYEVLTDDEHKLEYKGHILYRIKALRDFDDVHKGDIGGFIAHQQNLSHNGNCWVYDDAKAYEMAKIHSNAKLYNKANIHGINSLVDDDSKVYDNVEIIDYVHVLGKSIVKGNGTIEGTRNIYDEEVILK